MLLAHIGPFRPKGGDCDEKYEIMYIIRPNIEDEAKKALVERFNTILNMIMVRRLLKQKIGVNAVLAYEINDFRDGYYQIT